MVRAEEHQAKLADWMKRCGAVLGEGTDLMVESIEIGGDESEIPQDIVEFSIQCVAILAAALCAGFDGPLMAMSMIAHFTNEMALAIAAIEDDDDEPAVAEATTPGSGTVQ